VVLAKRDVWHVVRAVPDDAVVADPVQDEGEIGPSGAKTGEAMGGLLGARSRADRDPEAHPFEHLLVARPGEVVRQDGSQDQVAPLQAPMVAVGRAGGAIRLE
jgi:hypothetical protein